MTLETFCKEENLSTIDLLKMDREGSEYAIFAKSMEFIKVRIKSTFVEVYYLDSQRRITELEKFTTIPGLHLEDQTNVANTLLQKYKRSRSYQQGKWRAMTGHENILYYSDL